MRCGEGAFERAFAARPGARPYARLFPTDVPMAALAPAFDAVASALGQSAADDRALHSKEGTQRENAAAVTSVPGLVSAHSDGLTAAEHAEAELHHSAWRGVLHEVVVAMERGHAASLATRDTFLACGVGSAVGAAVCGAASGVMAASGWQVAAGLTSAVVGCGIFLAALLSLLRLRSTFAPSLTVALMVGTPAMGACAWLGEWAGAFAALSVYALLLSWGLVIVSVTSISSEMRAFRRARSQLRILLQRKPAVVA